MKLELFQYLEQNIQKNPRNIMFFPSRMTFGEAHNQIEGIKKRIKESGIKPGDRCLMLTPVGDEFHLNLIALLQYGAVPVLIDIALGWKTVWKSLKGIGIRYLVTKHRFFKLRKWKSSKVDDEKCDIIYFTSGSTGLPKKVYYQLTGLASQIQILRRSRYEFDKKTIFNLKEPRLVEGRILYGYSSLPVFGFYQLLMGMGIWSRPIKSGPELQNALSGVNIGVITDLCLNPKILSEWLRFINSKYLAVSDSVERIAIVSAPLPRPTLEQLKLKIPLHCGIEQTYGCTEVFPISQCVYSDPHQNPYWSSRAAKSGYIQPELGIEFRPSNNHYNIEGISHPPIEQIWIRDFKKNWINTGDLGFLTESGELVVLGREKFTYKYKNKTYFSLLWELKAREITEVKDAVLMQEKINKKPTLVVSLRREKIIPINLGIRQTESDQHLARKRSINEICNELKIKLDKEFNSEFEILIARDLPLDPRHHIKILRDQISLTKLRLSLSNILRLQKEKNIFKKELV